MSTTRVLATALPYSLSADARFHASVFLTHRLSPESEGATLTDFPAAEVWVKTLRAGELVLVTDTAPDGIPVRWVSEPDQGTGPRSSHPTPSSPGSPHRRSPVSPG